MKINSIFQKNINRNIETVIKADDRDHISDEVAEYVITNEISKKRSESSFPRTIHMQVPMVFGYQGFSGVVSHTY